MSGLQWMDTPSGFPVLAREGRLLGSPRDPLKEANDWLLRNKSLIQASDAVGVVGAGSGYHVQVLEQNYPEKSILVFDIDPIFLNLEKKFSSSIIVGVEADQIRKDNKVFFEKWPVMIPFRPAFQPMDRQYVELWMGLAQRTQSVIDKLVSGRGYESVQEQKVWMCLRELVK